MKTSKIPLETKQEMAKMPMMIQKSILEIIWTKYYTIILQFNCSIFHTLYPAYVDHYGHSVFELGSTEFENHLFYSVSFIY